jgi:ketosteroid isomerase-like protein
MPAGTAKLFPPIQGRKMSAEENKKIVQKFYAASNGGDMATCMNLIADDIKWTNIGSTSLSGTFQGKAELEEKLLGPLFGRLQQGIFSTVHRLIAENDFVVAQTSGKAQSIDGQPYNNTYIWLIRIRDGKFAEVTEYMDTELGSRVFG